MTVATAVRVANGMTLPFAKPLGQRKTVALHAVTYSCYSAIQARRFFRVFYDFLQYFLLGALCYHNLFTVVKELLLGNILHTYNMIIGSVKNFLATLEVKFSSKS